MKLEKEKAKLIKKIEKMSLEEFIFFVQLPDCDIEQCKYCIGKENGSRKCLKLVDCDDGIREYLESE